MSASDRGAALCALVDGCEDGRSPAFDANSDAENALQVFENLAGRSRADVGIRVRGNGDSLLCGSMAVDTFTASDAVKIKLISFEETDQLAAFEDSASAGALAVRFRRFFRSVRQWAFARWPMIDERSGRQSAVAAFERRRRSLPVGGWLRRILRQLRSRGLLRRRFLAVESFRAIQESQGNDLAHFAANVLNERIQRNGQL